VSQGLYVALRGAVINRHPLAVIQINEACADPAAATDNKGGGIGSINESLHWKLAISRFER
jgi:hypothetical protein